MPSQGLLLPILSGLLLALSFPPFHLVLPPFVALVPFVVHLRRLPDGAADGRAGFRAGGALGVVYFGLLLVWLLPALSWLTPVGPVLYVVVVVLLAAFPAAVGWSVIRLVRRGGVPTILALPVAWTAGEWIRGSLPGGLAFPWLGLGTSLTAQPEIVGIAELVGTRGVTFWIVLVNALVAEVVLGYLGDEGIPEPRSGDGMPGTGGHGRVRRGSGASAPRWTVSVRAVVLAVVLAVPAGWSLWRARTLPVTPVARLALVRTDVSAAVKGNPRSAMDVTRAQLRELGFGDGRETFPASDLVVWPETVFPIPLPDPSEDHAGGEGRGPEGAAPDPLDSPDSADPAREAVAWAVTVSSEERAPVLFGALDSIPPGAPDGPAESNAAFLVEPRPSAVDRPEAGGEDASGGGRPLDDEGIRTTGGESLPSVVYRKRFLVPLVESSPRLLPWLPDLRRSGESRGRSDGSGSPGLAAGGGAGPISLPNLGADRPSRLGILICFESAFPEASRRYRAEGADFLVNMTNDVWFGEGGGPLAVAGARQHEAHLVMRAVENRMGVARSANGGGTFFVDPVGRIHGRAGDESPGVAVAEVTTSLVHTLYSRTGDVVGPGCTAAAVLLLLASGWRAPAPGGRRDA